MTVLKIAQIGHPILLERCQPAADPGAPEIRRLMQDMFDTMDDAPGAGLAAPQVHVPLRLFVFRVQPHRSTGAPGDTVVGNTVVIIPVVEQLGDKMQLRWEGCLSIPSLRAAVPRFLRIRYSGVDCDGQPFTADVSGFHTGVVQHENDHLDGILYPVWFCQGSCHLGDISERATLVGSGSSGGGVPEMDCVCCGSVAVAERPECTAQGYRRFRCRDCGRQFNERSSGQLNRAQYPSDVITLVVL
jgi:peptide deformylase